MHARPIIDPSTNRPLRELFPEPSATVDLAETYEFPQEAAHWVRANFVASLDGAAAVDGRAGGLGNETDVRIFARLRALADVILVGSGTARAEGYGPMRTAAEWRDLRLGRSATAPIAVVTNSGHLDTTAPLFTEAPAEARTIVILPAAVGRERRQQLARAADVIVAGQDEVDPTSAIAQLVERGYPRISCEGGPRFFSSLIETNCLDELCLTTSPLLVGSDAPRITHGEALATPRHMGLARLLTDGSFLYSRYVRDDVLDLVVG